MSNPRAISATEAAAQLGVQVATLYAYVSRGLIRSENVGDGKRARRYLVEDVAQLTARKRARRHPAEAVQQALHWGTPVMDTRLTLISDGRLIYRGRDATVLTSAASIEQVAGLLWLGDLNAGEQLFANRFAISPDCRWVLRQLDGLTVTQKMQAILPIAGAGDAAAYDLRPSAVIQTGVRIVQLLTAVATQSSTVHGPLSEALERHWAPGKPSAAALINAALVLCADHELNVSAFTARCVASSGATPYNVVTAGLAALHGIRHGAVTGRIEDVWHDLYTQPTRGTGRVLADWLKRGEGIPGFGHVLYPQGDPRAAELIRLMAQAYPKAQVIKQSASLVRAVDALIHQAPTIDLALVVLARLLDLPGDGALTLFALGRTIGWIGHALEQYQTGQILRPRARYVGEPVGAGPEHP